MEREARETRERASNASKARAERAARTARAGARRQRTTAWREWREPTEDRDSNPVRSLMPLRGRCAACAGRLELGAFRALLSRGYLGNFRLVLSGSIPESQNVKQHEVKPRGKSSEGLDKNDRENAPGNA